VPESRDPSSAPIDFAGAALAVVSLASLVFGLTEAARRHAGSAVVWAPLAAGIAAAAAFVVRESRAAHPMLPLELFRSRAFSAANAFTLLLYAGLGAALFFVPFELIQARGESPTRAGASLLPFVAEMSALSRLTGRLGGRIGPRLPLAGGAITTAVGLALFLILPPAAGFAAAVLLPIAILGLGMTLAVPTLTAAVMGSADPKHAGIVSAFNNAVSRLGGLLAIAALTIAVAGTPGAFSAPDSRGFRIAMGGAAVLALSAAVLAVLAFPAGKPRRHRAANPPGG
ncbi:MAG TPA: MFS transporter, partial [Thermoanaerobaculia bacterium]|nr:MFS transporter [Thermoanaerobaculia bacterium]